MEKDGGRKAGESANELFLYISGDFPAHELAKHESMRKTAASLFSAWMYKQPFTKEKAQKVADMTPLFIAYTDRVVRMNLSAPDSEVAETLVQVR